VRNLIKINRYTSIFMLVVMMAGLFLPNLLSTDEAEAAVVGISGSIPAGGTPNPGGGITSPSQYSYGYRVGLVSETMKPSAQFKEGDRNTQLTEKIKIQYNNHYPKMSNSCDTFALEYSNKGTNHQLKISGTQHPTSAIPNPLLAVFSSTKSSADDLKVSGTH